MCLNPILRPNPNWSGKSSNKKTPSYRARIATLVSAYGKDVDNSKIYVPCGHCAECVQAKQNQLVQRVENESKYNHLFFATLTYDNKHLPKLSVEVPVVPPSERDSEFDSSQHHETGDLFCLQLLDGQEIPQDVRDRLEQRDRDIDSYLEMAIQDLDEPKPVENFEPQDPLANPDIVDSTTGELLEPEYRTVEMPFADIHHIQLMMKNLRDNNPCDGRELRYLAVSELGKANGRPHFHVLFLVEKRDSDYEWFNGVHRVKPSVSYNLERSLWKAVFKYWSINVGTRKNPVYEPLFTYRKRFLGSRVYTNFDLHYVDPRKTTSGTANVAYYVTKYIMKGSDRERRRQQFLRLNLTDIQYQAAWNTIKCRVLMSKGLGLDGRFYTTEKVVHYRNPDFNLEDYANTLTAIVDHDDLPPDDIPCPQPTLYRIEKRRIMVPNFELCDFIRKNLTCDVGRAPGPVHIGLDGKHRPLAHYYQKYSYIYTDLAFLDIYLNYDDRADSPHWEMPLEEKKKIEDKHQQRLKTIDNNSTFDTSPALLWGGEIGTEDNNRFRCYGN